MAAEKRECPVCGSQVAQLQRGRPKVYCSPECRSKKRAVVDTIVATTDSQDSAVQDDVTSAWEDVYDVLEGQCDDTCFVIDDEWFRDWDKNDNGARVQILFVSLSYIVPKQWAGRNEFFEQLGGAFVTAGKGILALQTPDDKPEKTELDT